MPSDGPDAAPASPPAVGGSAGATTSPPATTTTTGRSTRGDSRERMIRATGRLLRQHGFHATGLNQIVAESGAPKGSMYFHFPDGKVQLAAEAVEHFGNRVTEFLAQLLADNPTTGSAIAAYLDAVGGAMERSEFTQGCAIATVALEAAAQEPRLGDVCDDALRTWISMVAACLVDDGLSAAEAEARATLAVAAFEGAFVLTKARRSLDPLRIVARQVEKLLDAPA